jgi:NADP-dependent 3-hydroxy acid dehydrogenase YdfG
LRDRRIHNSAETLFNGFNLAPSTRISTTAMASITGHLFAITGAASGIGRATVELLAKSGALLSLADKDGEAVQHLARTLTENGVSAYWKQVDVRNRDEVEAWIAGTVEHFEHLLDGE